MKRFFISLSGSFVKPFARLTLTKRSQKLDFSTLIGPKHTCVSEDRLKKGVAALGALRT